MFLLAFYILCEVILKSFILSEKTTFSQTNSSRKLWWQIFEDKTLSIASIVIVLIICLIIILIITCCLCYFFRSRSRSKPSSKENGVEKELDENPTVRSVIETKSESKSSKSKPNKNKNSSSKSPKSSIPKPEANDDTFSTAFSALESQV